MGYRVPFLSDPPLSAEPIPFLSYSPTSIRGKALEKEVQSLVQNGAVELVPFPSPGFYSRIFVVMKASGSWRPVIDLSTLNLRVCKTPFKMETLQSVLLSVRNGDWMVSIDLKDAYLQVPIHPDSRKYLRFVALNQVFQFKALFFWSLYGSAGFHTGHGSGLGHSASPRCPHVQIPGRLVDPGFVSLFGHPSLGQGCASLSGVGYCHQLGEVQSPSIPESCVSRGDPRLHSFQGFSLPSESREAMFNRRRIPVLRRAASFFLANASFWRMLLGVLSSLTPLIPGCRLRMRSLQLRLHYLWDEEDDSTLILWDPACHQDLEWWIVPGRLQAGIYLAQVNPHLDFWSDASDVGWGAHLLDATASGLWSLEEALLSINARELLAVEYGLRHFHLLTSNSAVAVFSDNSTALAYLRKQGGTRSPVLNSISQRILRWAETIDFVLAPQFIQGKNNVLADSLSRPNQVQRSELTLKWEVFRQLNSKWPVMIDLFATSLSHPPLFTLFFALPQSVGDRYGCASSEL